MPKSNKRINDNKQESAPRIKFSEFFVSNYSSTSSHIVAEMDLEFGNISNPYATIAANPGYSHAEGSKMRRLGTSGNAGGV